MFNEEIFFLSHGDYKSPGVSVRVMDIYTFMNSKVLTWSQSHSTAWLIAPCLPAAPVVKKGDARMGKRHSLDMWCTAQGACCQLR